MQELWLFEKKKVSKMETNKKLSNLSKLMMISFLWTTPLMANTKVIDIEVTSSVMTYFNCEDEIENCEVQEMTTLEPNNALPLQIREILKTSEMQKELKKIIKNGKFEGLSFNLKVQNLTSNDVNALTGIGADLEIIGFNKNGNVEIVGSVIVDIENINESRYEIRRGLKEITWDIDLYNTLLKEEKN